MKTPRPSTREEYARKFDDEVSRKLHPRQRDPEPHYNKKPPTGGTYYAYNESREEMSESMQEANEQLACVIPARLPADFVRAHPQFSTYANVVGMWHEMALAFAKDHGKRVTRKATLRKAKEDRDAE